MEGDNEEPGLTANISSPQGLFFRFITGRPFTSDVGQVASDVTSEAPSAHIGSERQRTSLDNTIQMLNSAVHFLSNVTYVSEERAAMDVSDMIRSGTGEADASGPSADRSLALPGRIAALIGEAALSVTEANDLPHFINTSTIHPGANVTNSTATEMQPLTVAKVVIISIVVTILAILTAGGNLMVMVSFKMDKQLQTVSNYFLLSLSIADFFIGVFSMPLYTVYLLMKWPLGPLVCDIWLSLDYTMSNASVANLLLISFDRYFSVTRPLTYRAKRTPRRAAIMISCAWIISVLVWTPWIFAWPYIEGERTVPHNECYIQFLDTNQYITIITAIAAFYLPVMIMIVLYFKIYLETERRNKGLAHLQAAAQVSDSRRYGESDEDDAATSLQLSQKRSDFPPDFEELEDITDAIHEQRHRRRSCWHKLRHCCRIDREDTGEFADDLSSSEPPGSPTYQQCTPSSSQHVIPIRRDQSLHKVDGGVAAAEGRHPLARHHIHHHHHLHQNGRHNQHRKDSASGMMIPLITVDSTRSTPIATPSTDLTGTFSKHSNLTSSTSVTLGGTETPDSLKDPPRRRDKEDMYTIVIKLPDKTSDPTAKPTIKMITDSEDDDDRNANEMTSLTKGKDSEPEADDAKDTDDAGEDDSSSSVARRFTQTDNLRMAMQARVAVKLANKMKTQRARKQRIERKQDRKAAKTLSAILLAFIVTWTPYNIFTVIETFCTQSCINATVYAIGT